MTIRGSRRAAYQLLRFRAAVLVVALLHSGARESGVYPLHFGFLGIIGKARGGTLATDLEQLDDDDLDEAKAKGRCDDQGNNIVG